MRERFLERRPSRIASEGGLGEELRPQGFREERLVPDVAGDSDRRLGVVDGLGQPLAELEEGTRNAFMRLRTYGLVVAGLDDRLQVEVDRSSEVVVVGAHAREAREHSCPLRARCRSCE